LAQAKDLTIDKMIHEIGYSHYLSAFEILLPPLLQAYAELNAGDSLKILLREPIELIRAWDRSSADSSVASTIAIEWAYRMAQKASPAANTYETSNGIGQLNSMIENTSPRDKLHFLSATIADLQKRFGNWKIPWGEINRYQRTTDGRFDDNKPSLPVGLAASTWGSLPSFVTRRSTETNKRYGISGNSFIACVEFGKKLKAKSIITGGQSFDPSSRHFTDQADMYIKGNFKDVLFYKQDVLKHAVKTYHPGEE
jgi:acyl-homoserine-lactone acylase